jgi:hypothetical protein
MTVDMTDQRQLLTAELKAIDFWDGMLVNNPRPDAIEKDAGLARFFRRLEIIVELKKSRQKKVTGKRT